MIMGQKTSRATCHAQESETSKWIRLDKVCQDFLCDPVHEMVIFDIPDDLIPSTGAQR